MADEEKKEPNGEELSDIEIAELANNELRKRDAEIASLRKELAKQKLLSTAETDGEDTVLTREECMERLSSGRTTNYDYAEAVVSLVDLEVSEGKPNPLGKNGEQVYQFFKDVLAECGDDKTRFPQVYQAMLGNDPPEIAAAWKKRNQK